MKPLPQTDNPLVLRTDFSDQQVWQEVRAMIEMPVGFLRFRAYVDFLDDSQYAGLTSQGLPDALPKDYNQTFILLADQVTMSHRERPLLVVDLFEYSFREFRALPSQVQNIENNLSIGNMDFEEFADAVGADGIFRGF